MVTTVRFTLDEYDRMIEQGVFDETRDQRIELIYGELREMSPPGPVHEDVIDRLNRWSTRHTDPDQIRVRIQNSVGVPELDSAPQPDVAWVAEKSYRTGRPRPSDVLLIVEVSDSSYRYDSGTKAELYAAAGVQDYWIVNIPDWCLEVYRKPSPRGYRVKTTAEFHDTVSPLALPSVTLTVSSLFGGAVPE